MAHRNVSLTMLGRHRAVSQVIERGQPIAHVAAEFHIARATRSEQVGHTNLHSIVDGYSRLAYTEALEDETATTTTAFFQRARSFFAQHGITWISRLVTDNGKNYTARSFRRST